jgi:dihydroorotate dehydrogenase
MDSEPIYNIEKTYQENLEEGPFFTGTLPERVWPKIDQWYDFLGYKVASRIGVPAGPLLNANWVILAARLGFDIVTYKTIRSKKQVAHPLPNMVYISSKTAIRQGQGPETVVQSTLLPSSIEELALTNSFGIPSQPPEFLLEDIAKAKQALHPGQLMIVSVVGTPREGEDFVEDFVKAARVAKEAGAEIIEADFSCPNVASKEGSLHLDPVAVEMISRAMVAELKDIPLIIKLGVIPTKERLKEVMIAAAKAGVRAICGINTVSKKVIKEDGTPALGKNRLTAGVCGGPIREEALHFMRMAHAVNKEEKLGLTLMLTGGAVLPEHFDLFLEAGADIAMSAVGMMWDPYLAARYHGMKR